MKIRTTCRHRGLTLVETVISMGILFLAGIGTISAIIYTRQMMEINKQTLTAMNYTRQILEAAATNSGVDAMTTRTVLRFNDPGLNVDAEIALEYYPISTTGTVQWHLPSKFAIGGEPSYCRCVLTWDSMGSTGRKRNVTMSTIVRQGTL